MRALLRRAAAAAASLLFLTPIVGRAAPSERAVIGEAVTQAVRPVMVRYAIPGMAVGVTVNGRTYIYDYGVASRATRRPVTDATQFEIGSISKTFTATLTAYAQVKGRLSLSDMASRDFPALAGSAFDRVSLLNLATHTTGGMPLQVPDGINNQAQLIGYFRAWKPAHAPGSYRTYANPSIGLLGLITARRLNGDFNALEQGIIFPGFGLKHTYLQVPAAEDVNYAQGYTAGGAPVRMTPEVVASETYGVRTTAGDLLRVVQANMDLIPLGPALRRAVADTHVGYYRIGPMTQDLVWEQYPYPVALADLLAGNGAGIALEANPAARIDPLLAPREDVLINKTGSTNGFGAYVAFAPVRKIGVVLLANRSYPNEARVTAAYAILTRLAAPAAKPSGAGGMAPLAPALAP